MSDELETPVASDEAETPVVESETTTPESVVADDATGTTEASDASEQSEPSKEGETTEESETSEEAISSNKVKKKFGKMTLKLKTLESENERLRAAQQSKTLEPSEKPKEEDYDDYAEYEDKLLDWKLDQREQVKETQRKELSSVSQMRDRQQGYQDRADVVRESKEDFDEVAMSPEMIDLYTNDARHVAEAIEGHERGPEIAYYLGSNPEIAVDLAKMSFVNAAIKIGEIGVKLSTSPKPKAVSKAGTPIKPIGGGGASEEGFDKKDPNGDNLSIDAWNAREDARERAKRA